MLINKKIPVQFRVLAKIVFVAKKKNISKKKFTTNFNNFFNILVRSSLQSGLTEVIEECVQRNVCVSVC